MTATNLKKFTIDEYLKLEKESDIRYEYNHGILKSMAGGSINHSKICANVFGQLYLNLKSSSCKPYTSELKIHVDEAKSYFYPDASVICDELIPSKENKNAATNPKVIIEVISESSANYDRSEKFEKYRLLKSLEEYILINQDVARIDVFKRVKHLWGIVSVVGLESTLKIDSLKIEISLKDIYENVKFGVAE